MNLEINKQINNHYKKKKIKEKKIKIEKKK